MQKRDYFACTWKQLCILGHTDSILTSGRDMMKALHCTYEEKLPRRVNWANEA
jgi:hypothetical protein